MCQTLTLLLPWLAMEEKIGEVDKKIGALDVKVEEKIGGEHQVLQQAEQTVGYSLCLARPTLVGQR